MDADHRQKEDSVAPRYLLLSRPFGEGREDNRSHEGDSARREDRIVAYSL